MAVELEHLNGHVGEIPSLDIPGVRIITVPGLLNREQFKKHIQRGPVRELIRGLHDQGKHVALRWSAGEIRLFIANHRKLLVALGGAGVAVGLGTFYLTRRRIKK